MTALRDVLVADDEPHIGRIVKTKLEQGPFRVTLVEDGAAALAAMEGDARFAVIVLDLMMPVLDGLTVLERVRATAHGATLPCVILTAAGQHEQRARAMALGATEFMTKPFSPRRLYARIAELAGVPPAPEPA